MTSNELNIRYTYGSKRSVSYANVSFYLVLAESII